MGRGDDIKKEDLFQAVVMADNFNGSFQPMTGSQPACLLPLAGRPLIEYTFQCLSYSGVQDVILYITSNSSKVKEWLKGSAWSPEYTAAPFTVSCIVNEDCRSFGDGMRDLYEKGVLRNTFALVTGDLVSNIDLKPFLSVHKDNFAKDKYSIMTAVYTQGYQGHPLRSKGKELILASDKQSNQILFYQRSDTKSTNFPVELFQHDEVDVIFDVLDPNIYICSPTVLALFSDNFDIQDMDTMMNEILESELVDSTIYLTHAKSGFACRAETPYLYGKVLEKVLNRWAYPVVPERRLAAGGSDRGGSDRGGSDRICLQNNHVYKAASATVEKGTTLGRNTFIGARVTLSTGSSFEDCSVESDCVVGKNVQMSGSVVMKNVKIGDNCVLTNCIVGEGVVIPDNCTINDQTVLGPDVLLKPGVNIPAGSRISAEASSDGFSDDEGEEGAEEGEFGPKAFIFVDEDQEADDDDDAEEVNLWGEVFSTDDEDESEEEDDDSEDGMEEGEEDSDDGFNEHDDVKNFRREVKDSLVRANEEGINTDNLVLEINGSKHAWNTTLSEVNQCVLESVLTLDVDTDLPPPKLLAAVKANIAKFKALLLKYSKSKSGQDYYLSIIADLIQRNPAFLEIIAKVLSILYELDILGDSSIQRWAQKLQDITLKKKIKPFLDWLEEDDSSSEEDED